MAKTILLIEDDEILGAMYKRKFVSAGLKFEVANDGYEGLEKLKVETPALVLLDIMLPRISGLEVLKKIKKNPLWKNIPVVILTDLGASHADEDKAKELGAVAYLLKADTTPSEVLEKVKSLIE